MSGLNQFALSGSDTASAYLPDVLLHLYGIKQKNLFGKVLMNKDYDKLFCLCLYVEMLYYFHY